jgi:hypothetical protein
MSFFQFSGRWEQKPAFFPPLFPHCLFCATDTAIFVGFFVQPVQKSRKKFVQYFFGKFGKTLDFWGARGYNSIKVVESGAKFPFRPKL